MSASVKTWPAVPGGRSTRRTSAFAMSLRTKASPARPASDVGNEHAVAKEMPGILLAQQARSIQLSEGEDSHFECPGGDLPSICPGRQWHKRRTC
jgi:hypothetical protein